MQTPSRFGYAYDLSGNMTNDGANALTYDAENELVTSGGTSGTYTYDGNGNRVKRVSVISGTTTTTVYAFSGSKVVAEYVNGALPAAPTREYIYAGAQLTAKIEAGATIYYHQDHLSNRVVTNSSGTSCMISASPSPRDCTKNPPPRNGLSEPIPFRQNEFMSHTSILGAGGTIAGRLGNYEPRPQQLAMAEEVRDRSGREREKWA